MNLIRLSRYLLIVVTVVVAASALPSLYWKAFDVRIRPPRVAYSPVTDEFLFMRPLDRAVEYVDAKGKTYTREEYEQLLPLGNYRQLASSGKMPDSLRGKPLDIRAVNINKVMLRIDPISVSVPQIPLYPLIESQSGRVRLEMPQEFFRIADRMEFIDVKSNRVVEDLSQMFSDSLRSRGFQFPAKLIRGNPTTMKPFDEGYFVVDGADHVYHLKKVRGKPLVADTKIPADLGIRHILVAEMPLQEFYGMIVTISNKLYLISYNNYQLIELPVPAYDAASTTLSFVGDLYFRTITVVGDSLLETVVTDRGYTVVDRYRESWKTRESMTAGGVAAFLFPFTLQWTDEKSPFVDPYLKRGDARALVGMVVCLVVALLWFRWRRKSFEEIWPDLVIVGLTGVFGLLAVWLIERPED